MTRPMTDEEWDRMCDESYERRKANYEARHPQGPTHICPECGEAEVGVKHDLCADCDPGAVTVSQERDEEADRGR